ncbi:MAG: hypothetical protein Q9197_006557 [Variospora fuerteventurae]
MARVPAKSAATAPVRTGALKHARTNEQRKSSYKVVIEEITEKKKKLHTTGTHQQPQRGSHQTTRSAQAKNDQATKPRAVSAGKEMDQSEIDARAAFAIRDLFPKIPERDVQLIVAQAFQKGTNKVGTAFDQPHIRRVHLAVGAYIRHTYTEYDRLLKTHGYFEARHMVEPSTLDKIIEWRDEKDDPDAVEDILREVIVISDDEDEISEDGHFGDRDSSVEIATSREISNEVHVEPVDYGTLDGRSRLERPVSPEDDWAPSVRFIRRLSTPPAGSRQQQDRIARHHAQRFQKWQDAISRHRRKDMANTEQSRIANPMESTGTGPPSAVCRIREPFDVDHGGSGNPSGFTDPKAAFRQDRFLRSTMKKPHTDGMNDMSRSGYHANSTNHMFGNNRTPLYRPSEATERPLSCAGPAYLESERPIPSVESDSYTSMTPREHLTNDRPAASQEQFQDHIIGPRVVEIDDDDPLSPAHKRRRVADDKLSSSKVMYSAVSTQNPSTLASTWPSMNGNYPNPRNNGYGISNSQMRWDGQGILCTRELVPVAGRDNQVSNVGRMCGNPERGTRLVTPENRMPDAFPGGRLEYQQPLASHPVQSHSRFPERLSARQVSDSYLSRTQPVFEMHEPSRPLRPIHTHSVASYTEKPYTDVLSRQIPEPAEYGPQGSASKPKPAYTTYQYRRMNTYDRPTAVQAFENPINMQTSMARAQNLTSHPHLQERQDSSNVVSHPLSLKLDCPMAVQGSFCNRLKENGFSRREHLVEHLRKVHLWDVQQTRKLDEVRADDLSQNQPGGHVTSRSSYLHTEGMHGDPRANWQAGALPKLKREQEVVYISSSPLVEER